MADRFKEGDRILVQSNDDELPELWHERLLAGEISPGRFIAVTPDETFDELDLLGPNIGAIRVLGADRKLPRGIRAESCYMVFVEGRRNHDWNAEELRSFMAEGGRLAAIVRRREAAAAPTTLPLARPTVRVRGKQPAAKAVARRAPSPAPAAGARAAGDRRPDAEDDDPGEVCWRCCELGGPVAFGSLLNAPESKHIVGDRCLVSVGGAQYVSGRRATFAEDQFVAAFGPEAGSAGSDARTLEVIENRGKRWREFLSAVDDSVQQPFADFPLEGPRTAGWCLDFLRRRQSPVVRTTAKLNADSWGVQEHEQAMRYLELAAQYDQLDCRSVAVVEAICRRAQTIEWCYHEKLREAESSASSGQKLSIEEATAFAGTSRAGDLLMVCPQLLDHVKSVVEKDAVIMKNLRKAREEREARRKQK